LISLVIFDDQQSNRAPGSRFGEIAKAAESLNLDQFVGAHPARIGEQADEPRRPLKAKRLRWSDPKPLAPSTIEKLAGATAKLAGNAAEHTGQLRAQVIHNSDDRYRDAGRDQAVFNGGRGSVVIHETRY
jgi:hypothetical protein